MFKPTRTDYVGTETTRMKYHSLYLKRSGEFDRYLLSVRSADVSATVTTASDVNRRSVGSRETRRFAVLLRPCRQARKRKIEKTRCAQETRVIVIRFDRRTGWVLYGLSRLCVCGLIKNSNVHRRHGQTIRPSPEGRNFRPYDMGKHSFCFIHLIKRMFTDDITSITPVPSTIPLPRTKNSEITSLN